MIEYAFRCRNCKETNNVKIYEFGDTPSEEMMADKSMTETFKHYLWTTEPPTEPGWYWAVEKEDREIGLVRVFRADHGGKDKPLEVWIDQYESMHLSDFTHWLGPLPIPEPPEKG